MKPNDAPDKWQCVLTCWGTKYGADDINKLITKIANHNHHVARFVVISDRVHKNLDARAEPVALPDVFIKPEFTTGGQCHAKLSMFQKGLLKTDMPAIYIDLDTAILGPIEQAFDFRKDEKSIVMFQSAVLPFSAFARLLFRLSKGKRYARGNSSFVVFHPKHWTEIADKFLAIYDAGEFREFRPTISDERYISWFAHDHMIALPNSFAVKFPTEYMQHHAILSYAKACIPWVRRRREKLSVVTLCSLELKPEKLVGLALNTHMSDSKGRVLVWNDFVLGGLRQKLIRYYAQDAAKDA